MLFMLYSSTKYNQQQPFIIDFEKQRRRRRRIRIEERQSDLNKTKGGRPREVVGGVVDVVAGVREKSRSSTP